MLKYSYIRFRLFSFLCIFLYGCSVMPNEMRTAERLMETAPDSALHILQHLSPGKRSSGSKRALYGLLLIRALDKNLMPLKPDSLLDFSINYYLGKGDDEHLAACYLYKGRSYNYAFEYEKAMEFYLKALDVAQIKKDNVIMARINLDMGDIHLFQRDYKESRKKYTLAYEYFSKANYQPQAFNSLISIGRTFHAAKEYQKAREYYPKIYSYTKDSLQKGLLLQEMAINFYDGHKFDSALVYFRKVIHYPYIGNNRAIRYYYFADLLFDLRQVDSAFYYAKNSFNYNPDIRTRRECYRILVNSESLKGNLQALSQYMAKYQECSDTIRKIDAQTRGSILETIHDTNKEVVKAQNNLWYMVGFTLLSALFGFILFLRIKKRNNITVHETEMEHYRQKAGIRIETMHKYRVTLLQKMDAVKKEQTDERKKATPAEKEQLILAMYEDLLHLNDPDFFHQKMNAVLNDMASKLKSRYPALTLKEINWCCLHLLDVPVTDIYLLLDYKVDSLKKMRQRVAQKTGLAGVTELDGFLKGILSE